MGFGEPLLQPSLWEIIKYKSSPLCDKFPFPGLSRYATVTPVMTKPSRLSHHFTDDICYIGPNSINSIKPVFESGPGGEIISLSFKTGLKGPGSINIMRPKSPPSRKPDPASSFSSLPW